MAHRHNYKNDKENLINFLTSFYIEDEKLDVGKVFAYAEQIQKLAEREQVHR